MMDTALQPLSATQAANSLSADSSSDHADLPPVASANVTRHTLKAEEELRIEVPFGNAHSCTLTLQHGSCELYGVELALQKPLVLPNGGLQIALFSWHGCVVDVDCASAFCYTSDETDANVAYVNTHAQLEALRDQAAAALATLQLTQQAASSSSINVHGPRVLVCGPLECGKSTLCKLLAAYACKLGRSPLLVELDPTSDSNLLTVPGTLGVCPLSRNALSAEALSTCTGIPPGTAAPLLLWHGLDPEESSAGSSTKKDTSSSSSKSLPLSPELYKAQVQTLADRIQARLAVNDSMTSSDPSQENELSSGLICNTPACLVEGEGFTLLQHAIDTLQIDVVLVLGHDRLYSMLKRHCQQPSSSATTTFTGKPPKVIKLPRSGGVVSRDNTFQRHLRNRAIKHYFYGSLQERVNPAGEGTSATTTNSKASSLVPQLTPFLLQLPMDQVTIYKFSSIRLSASLLPVASAQTSEAIQLVKVLPSSDDDTAAATTLLPHHVLAVCHQHAVQQYEQSGKASDLYQSGVAGFCVVERIVLDKLHLLTPCAGSLPSHVLLMGNVMWME